MRRSRRAGTAVGHRSAGAIAVLALISTVLFGAGCTSSTWDTSEIDHPAPTKPIRYSRDAVGVVASMTAYLAKPNQNLNQWSAKTSEAACAARRITDRITAPRLLALGYDPAHPSLGLLFNAEERTSTVNVLVGCIDFSRAVLELLSSYQKLPIPQANCMAKGFERLGLVRDLAGGVVDGTEPDPFANNNRYSRGMTQLAGQCLDAQALPPAGPLAPTPAGRDLTPAPTTTVAGTTKPRTVTSSTVTGATTTSVAPPKATP